MRGMALYVLAGVLVVLALDLFAPPVGLGLSVHAWSLAPPGVTLQYVDRTHKSDRLDLSVTTVDKQPAPTTPLPIMVGCDPVFSPLSRGAKANRPGRCAA